MRNAIFACRCIADAATKESPFELGIWVPAIVSVISLIVTTFFTVFVSPRIAAKNNQKTEMYKTCSEFFDYLTDIVSLSDYNGAPSTVRKYSLKIHLMFKSGTAPQSISNDLEEIFQKVKARKNLYEDAAIAQWEAEYRLSVRKLRVSLAKYIGVFKS